MSAWNELDGLLEAAADGEPTAARDVADYLLQLRPAHEPAKCRRARIDVSVVPAGGPLLVNSIRNATFRRDLELPVVHVVRDVDTAVRLLRTEDGLLIPALRLVASAVDELERPPTVLELYRRIIELTGPRVPDVILADYWYDTGVST